MKKTVIETKKYPLTPEGIDAVSEEVGRLCEMRSMDRKNILRYRLSVEESLNVWAAAFGKDKEVTLETKTRLLQPCLDLSCEGKSVNPYTTSSKDFGMGNYGMLFSLGLVPAYTYENRKNLLAFSLRRKEANPLLTLLLVIVSALLVGIAGQLLIPNSILSLLSESIISPISDTFFRVLSCLAGPMIFLSVAWGIYGIGDVYTLGRVGSRLLRHFLWVVFLFCLGGTVLYPLLGNGLSGAVSGESHWGTLFTMLLEIFPSNIFSPFVEGNSLQIIFLAFIIGLSMIFLGQRTSSVARAVEQINHIINFLMSFVSHLVPFFVFIILVQIIWSGDLATFATVWRFAVVFVPASFLFIFILAIYVGFRNKVSPIKLIRYCLPSYLIGLTTASSSAAFESNMSITKKKMGVSDSLASFGIPFGMVMFKPNTGLYYLLLCFYFCSVYDVSVSFGWIVIACAITAISAVSTPPIPGGAAATYTLLFLQLGIPEEALGIALAVDIVFDFVLTSGDMLSLLLEMFHLSHRTGMRKNESNS